MKYQTVQYVYKIFNNLLLKHLLEMSHESGCGYNLRGTLKFKICCVQTTMKSFHITKLLLFFLGNIKEHFKTRHPYFVT